MIVYPSLFTPNKLKQNLRARVNSEFKAWFGLFLSKESISFIRLKSPLNASLVVPQCLCLPLPPSTVGAK